MAGAQLVHYVPVSIPIDGLGLNVTGFTYAGQMWICGISCRDMLPDPAFFADCLRTAFALMKEAAEREAASTVAEAAVVEPGSAPVIEGRLVRRTRGTKRAKAPAAKRRVSRKKQGAQG
jgi:hypothetical protein